MNGKMYFFNDSVCRHEHFISLGIATELGGWRVSLVGWVGSGWG